MTSNAVEPLAHRPRDGFPNASSGVMAARQSGAVLLIALVVLVAMTLSALALIRTVNMTNLIAGNLAFRESALLSSEHGAEIAFKLLNEKSKENNGVWLQTSHPGPLPNGDGYLATRVDPSSTQSWSDFWNTKLKDQAVSVPTDAAGNTISYVVHRLCKEEGPPQFVVCSRPAGGDDGNSKNTGGDPPPPSNQVYYRITTQVKGPRNAIVYTQTTIVL